MSSKNKIVLSSLAALSLLLAMGSANARPIAYNADRSISFALGALYLQPSFGGNGLGYNSYSNYAGADNQQVITTFNDTNTINKVVPKWDWGYKVETAFYYCNGNDVDLNWSHLNEHVYGHLPHGSLFSGSVDGYYAGNLELTSNWDEVNLEFGRRLPLNLRNFLRMHAGVEYARIKNTFTNHPKLFLNSDPYFNSTDKLSYWGFGPRFGADYSFLITKGWDLYIKAAGSVLMGKAKQNIDGYKDTSNAIYGLIPYGLDNYQLNKNHVIVPELQAKLGTTYDVQVAGGNLGLDLGYVWVNYLNAVVSYTGIGIVGSSLGIPASSNFNLNGWYLGLKWVGDF